MPPHGALVVCANRARIEPTIGGACWDGLGNQPKHTIEPILP
jgi:hypothetical protein